MTERHSRLMPDSSEDPLGLIDQVARDFADLLFHASEISIGPGWVDILRKGLTKLREVAALCPGAVVGVTGVKEKFGRLRTGLSINFPEGANVEEEPYNGIYHRLLSVSEALEYESQSVCENCSDNGSTVTQRGGWLKTYCAACETKLRGGQYV